MIPDLWHAIYVWTIECQNSRIIMIVNFVPKAYQKIVYIMENNYNGGNATHSHTHASTL